MYYMFWIRSTLEDLATEQFTLKTKVIYIVDEKLIENIYFNAFIVHIHVTLVYWGFG